MNQEMITADILARARKLARKSGNAIGEVEEDFFRRHLSSDGSIDPRTISRNGMPAAILSKLLRDGVLVEHKSSANGSDINMEPLTRYVLADERAAALAKAVDVNDAGLKERQPALAGRIEALEAMLRRLINEGCDEQVLCSETIDDARKLLRRRK